LGLPPPRGTSTTTSPRSTRVIAAVSAVTPRVLCRYPEAPALSAARIPSVSGSADSTSTLVSGLASSIVPIASTLSTPAKCRSIRHRSGWLAATAATVSATVPAIVMSYACWARTVARASRNTTWSSPTTRLVTGWPGPGR